MAKSSSPSPPSMRRNLRRRPSNFEIRWCPVSFAEQSSPSWGLRRLQGLVDQVGRSSNSKIQLPVSRRHWSNYLTSTPYATGYVTKLFITAHSPGFRSDAMMETVTGTMLLPTWKAETLTTSRGPGSSRQINNSAKAAFCSGSESSSLIVCLSVVLGSTGNEGWECHSPR